MSLSSLVRAVPVLLVAALFAPTAPAADPVASDPVKDLRAALLQPPGPGGSEARKKDLSHLADALHSPGQLAAALALDAWEQSSPNQFGGPGGGVQLLLGWEICAWPW